MPTYFRLHPEDEDPQELLEPENQVSRPWGGVDRGHCDKCGGDGRTTFHCQSCTRVVDPRCEICHGEVRFEAECPACRGTGRITEPQRDGVSVFRDPDGLYQYMLRRGADLAGSVVVELEGRDSDEPDFDADEGALLVFPTAIVGTAAPDERRMDELRRELG